MPPGIKVVQVSQHLWNDDRYIEERQEVVGKNTAEAATTA